MSSHVKTKLDRAVEDLKGELETSLVQTGEGGSVKDLEDGLNHIMLAARDVQEAIDESDDDTYPGWFATDDSPPPPHA